MEKDYPIYENLPKKKYGKGLEIHMEKGFLIPLVSGLFLALASFREASSIHKPHRPSLDLANEVVKFCGARLQMSFDTKRPAGAIEPSLTLRQTIAAWNDIARELAEPPRKRRHQSAKYQKTS